MQELAWASYSLLRNTNSSGVLVAGSKGNLQVVRGAVRQAAGPQKGQAVLDDMQKVRKKLADQLHPSTEMPATFLDAVCSVCDFRSAAPHSIGCRCHNRDIDDVMLMCLLLTVRCTGSGTSSG